MVAVMMALYVVLVEWWATLSRLLLRFEVVEKTGGS
jgi:hypothetical protein